MPFYLIDVSEDNDALELLDYTQSETLVRAFDVATARSTHAEDSTTYTMEPGDVVVDLDPTFLPSIPAAGWTEINGYTYRGLRIAMMKAAQPVYYYCDVSTDGNGANLASYTVAAPATQEIVYAQGAIAAFEGVTMADGDFIVAFHPDHVPAIPAGWTRLTADQYNGLKVLIAKQVS